MGHAALPKEEAAAAAANLEIVDLDEKQSSGCYCVVNVLNRGPSSSQLIMLLLVPKLSWGMGLDPVTG